MSNKVFVLNSYDSGFDTPTLGVYTSLESALKAKKLFIDCVCDDVSISELELDSFEVPDYDCLITTPSIVSPQ